MIENSTQDERADHASATATADVTGPEYDDPDEDDPGFAARYGVRQGMSRVRKITLGAFGFAMLCAVAGYVAWNQANPQIQATVIRYTTNASSIRVTFEVDKSASQSVQCTVQAQDVQGSVIGQADVSVPSGKATQDVVYTVNTTGTPNTAEVSNCTVTN